MPSASSTRRLGTGHEEGAVGLGRDSGGIDRCEEARPTRARLELRVRSEELGVAARAAVPAGCMLVPQLPAEGFFSPFLAKHPVLLGGEFGPPLRVRLGG